MTEPDRGRDGFTRRNVLRKGATAGAAVVAGTAASGTAGATRKRGGRAQIDGEVRQNEPFTIASPGTTQMPASCMSNRSSMQVYLSYEINYCGSDDETDATLHVIPDEAELAPNEVYEIHAVTPCRADNNDNQRVAFGPSNEPCN